MTGMKRIPGSFRDPSGAVYEDTDGTIVRTINACYAEDWKAAEPFLQDNAQAGRVIPFHEIESVNRCWKTLAVDRLPFITYPYEWCFSQLRDAALLTLDLQRRALRSGMVLKDATAYNVQFDGARPVFIDLLSFARYRTGEPWQAYRQFCMHFLAPLALASYVESRMGRLSELWVGGIPLGLASKLLPTRTWFRFGLAGHLHLHARYEDGYGDARRAEKKVKKIRLDATSLTAIADSLTRTIRNIRPPAMKTEWADYYDDTNYTDSAAVGKYEFIEKAAKAHGPGELAMDLGANTGKYSVPLTKWFRTVLAVDIDPLAVERHYQTIRQNGPDNIIPIILDLANPSAAIGWGNEERASFGARARVDFLTALALIHHLVITAGIPLGMVADTLSSFLAPGGVMIVEFVPKEDSQVERLLAVRPDIFDDYTEETMLNVFSRTCRHVESVSVPESLRTLHVFAK